MVTAYNIAEKTSQWRFDALSSLFLAIVIIRPAHPEEEGGLIIWNTLKVLNQIII